MADVSSPSNIYTGNSNSTFMTTGCPSSETDYTMYYKAALIILFLLASGVISGFAALTGAVRSLTLREQRSSCDSHVEDVEAGSSTSLLHKPDVCEEALEVNLPKLAPPEAAKVPDHDARGQNPYPSDPEHPSSLPSREKKRRNFWKKVHNAVPSGWATHAMNVAAVTVGCVLSGPPTVQCDLPTPGTGSRRSC